MDILLIIHIFITVSLIGIILLQRSGTDGLSGIGGGGGNSFMSARATGNFLTRLTAILATLFMANSLLLAYMAAHTTRDGENILEQISAESDSGTKNAGKDESSAPEGISKETPAEEVEKGKTVLPVAE